MVFVAENNRSDAKTVDVSMSQTLLQNPTQKMLDNSVSKCTLMVWDLEQLLELRKLTTQPL